MSHLQLPQSRREFLRFLGRSGVTLTAASSLPFLVQCTKGNDKELSLPFRPISPSFKDSVVLAEGFSYDILIGRGDSINSKGETFGSNNDFITMIPFEGKPDEAILWVNHEAFSPLFVSGHKEGQPRTKAQVIKEQKEVGGSLLKIKRQASGKWTVIKNDLHNRRIDATTPIPIIAERPIAGSKTAIGTLANCAGGKTPWGTVLTCEENYDKFYGEVGYDVKKAEKTTGGEYAWEKFFNHSPKHYGWVVEIDPLSGKAKKLTNMGRFAHECATVVPLKHGRCAVYLADDEVDQCIYKFITDKPNSLESGELFVADVKNGKWISLSRDKNPLLKKKFKDQTELLIRTRQAAALVGGSPLDRPEDIEVDPVNGAVYVSLTKNKDKGNFHGSILKLVEDNNDYGSMTFKSETFLTGGRDTAFSCPDNMVFDKKGNLWLTCDISGKNIGKAPYAEFKNNGLYYIPLSGPNAGKAQQVASAPVDAEFTGPCFSEDGKTLFLSVQHPGDDSKDLTNLRSHWPDGGSSIPRSSVITISGPAMDKLTN